MGRAPLSDFSPDGTQHLPQKEITRPGVFAWVLRQLLHLKDRGTALVGLSAPEESARREGLLPPKDQKRREDIERALLRKREALESPDHFHEDFQRLRDLVEQDVRTEKPRYDLLAWAPGASVNINPNPGTLQTVRVALGLSSNADRNILREARGGVFFFDPGSAERIRRQIPETHRLEGNLFVHVARNGETSILLPHGTPIPGDGIEQMLLDSEVRRKLKEAGAVLGGSELLLIPQRDKATAFFERLGAPYSARPGSDARTVTNSDSRLTTEIMFGGHAQHTLHLASLVREVTREREQDATGWRARADNIAEAMQSDLRAWSDRPGEEAGRTGKALHGAFVGLAFQLFGEQMTEEKRARVNEVHGLYQGVTHNQQMFFEKYDLLHQRIMSGPLCWFLLRSNLCGKPKTPAQEVQSFAGVPHADVDRIIRTHMGRFVDRVSLPGYKALLAGLIRWQRGEQGLPYNATGEQVLQYLNDRQLAHTLGTNAGNAKEVFDHFRRLLSAEEWFNARHPAGTAHAPGNVPPDIAHNRRPIASPMLLQAMTVELLQLTQAINASHSQSTPHAVPCGAFLAALRRAVGSDVQLPEAFNVLQADPFLSGSTEAAFDELLHWVNRSLHFPIGLCIMVDRTGAIAAHVQSWDTPDELRTPWGTARVVDATTVGPAPAFAYGTLGFIDESRFKGTGEQAFSYYQSIPEAERSTYLRHLLDAVSAGHAPVDAWDAGFTALGRKEEFEHTKRNLVQNAIQRATGMGLGMSLARDEVKDHYMNAYGVDEAGWDTLMRNPVHRMLMVQSTEEARALLGALIATMEQQIKDGKHDLANALFLQVFDASASKGARAVSLARRMITDDPGEVWKVIHEAGAKETLDMMAHHLGTPMLVHVFNWEHNALSPNTDLALGVHDSPSQYKLLLLKRVYARLFHSPETVLTEMQPDSSAVAVLAPSVLERLAPDGSKKAAEEMATLKGASDALRTLPMAQRAAPRAELGKQISTYLAAYSQNLVSMNAHYDLVLRLQLAELLIGDLPGVNLKDPNVRRAILEAHAMAGRGEVTTSGLFSHLLPRAHAMRASGLSSEVCMNLFRSSITGSPVASRPTADLLADPQLQVLKEVRETEAKRQELLRTGEAKFNFLKDGSAFMRLPVEEMQILYNDRRRRAAELRRDHGIDIDDADVEREFGVYVERCARIEQRQERVSSIYRYLVELAKTNPEEALQRAHALHTLDLQMEVAEAAILLKSPKPSSRARGIEMLSSVLFDIRTQGHGQYFEKLRAHAATLLAHAYVSAGEIQLALQTARNILPAAQEIRKPIRRENAIQEAYSVLVKALSTRQDRTEAVAKAEEWLASAKSIDPTFLELKEKSLQRAYDRLITLYLLTGQLDKASAMVNERMIAARLILSNQRMRELSVALTFDQRYEVHAAAGRWTAAAKAATDALEYAGTMTADRRTTFRSIQVAYTRLIQAHVVQGQIEQAVTVAQDKARHARAAHDQIVGAMPRIRSMRHAYYLLTAMQLRLGKLSDAQETLKKFALVVPGFHDQGYCYLTVAHALLDRNATPSDVFMHARTLVEKFPKRKDSWRLLCIYISRNEAQRNLPFTLLNVARDAGRITSSLHATLTQECRTWIAEFLQSPPVTVVEILGPTFAENAAGEVAQDSVLSASPALQPPGGDE